MKADAWLALFSGGTLFVAIVAAVIGLEQLVQYNKDKRDERRPYVIVDFLMSDSYLCISAQNIGRSAASDVRITFDPELTSTNSRMEQEVRQLLTRSISFMAPERKLVWFLDSWVVAFQKIGDFPHLYKVKVSYSEVARKKTRFRKKIKLSERFDDPEQILDLKQYDGTSIKDTQH